MSLIHFVATVTVSVVLGAAPLVSREDGLVLLQMRAEALGGEDAAAGPASSLAVATGAQLSEWGYQKVAALKDDDAMKIYVGRVLEAAHFAVNDLGALSGFVPHYSGNIAVQSLEQMKEELAKATWVSPIPKEQRAKTGPIQRVDLSLEQASAVQQAHVTDTTPFLEETMRQVLVEKAAAKEHEKKQEEQEAQGKGTRLEVATEGMAARTQLKDAAKVHKKKTRKTHGHSRKRKPRQQSVLQETAETATAVIAQDSTSDHAAPAAPLAPAAAESRTNAVDTSSENVMDWMNSKIGQLKASLSGEQRENEQQLANEKTLYEGKLEAQRQDIASATSAIANMTAEAAKLEQQNEDTKATAKALERDCAKLSETLEDMWANLTFAQEFANESLDASDDSFASDLEVLAELDQDEDKAAAVQKHRQRLDAIEELSLLTVDTAVISGSRRHDGDVADKKTAPEGLLEVLNGNLDEAAKFHIEAREALKAAFLQDFQAGEGKLQKLAEEQRASQARLSAGVDLQKRIKVAQGVLVEKRAKLEKQKQQVKFFLRRIGAPNATL